MVTHTLYHLYDLDNVLPIVCRRILAGEFSSKEEIARAYGVHWETVKKHWRPRAIKAGLITPAAWRKGILKGRRQVAA